MQIVVELSEAEIRGILAEFINTNFNVEVKGADLPIESKSKQNYKSEWETAAIRVKCTISSTVSSLPRSKF